MFDASLFWLMLRYAEAVSGHDPFTTSPVLPPQPPAYLQDCLRKSGNPDGALESCAFLALTQLDSGIEQLHQRHTGDAAWDETLQHFKNYRGARCRLESEGNAELLCRIRLSQEYLQDMQQLRR
jgi:glucarate dehydratase